MVGLFKRIFGGPTTDDLRKDKNTQEHSSDQSKSDTDYSRVTDHSIPGAPYFEQLENLTSSISARNYPEAAKAARASLPLVRIWLDIRRDDGKPLGISIPALSQGGTMMAITADKDGLSELRKLVQDFHHLEAYRGEVEEHFVDLDLFNQIRKIVRQSPGVLQNRIKGELGVNDGRRASRLVSYLEKSGELIRAKSGKSYKLFLADVKLPGDALAAIYSEPKSPGSHRQNSHAAIPRELNPKTATVVPLPPSPNSWEQPVILPITQDDFADPEGAWNEIAVETIGRTDRPDPAFRKHFSTSNGALSFDDLAKSEASSGAPGAVMFSNMRGETKALAPLRRDAYGISVHPEGNGFAVRSKSNVLTIYNEHLEVDFETDLEQVPEVTENRNRLRMTGSEGHREVRCVALTPKRDRYLFTHIDEAWCVSRDGELLWGLRMPANEPPRIRVGVPGFGTAREIEEAL